MGHERSTTNEKAKDLAESLSAREQQVLRLHVTDLRAPEIAKELFLSVNTLRSHIKSLYRKLDAHSWYETVAKGRQANLQSGIGELGMQVVQTAKEALAMAEQLGDEGKPIRALTLSILAISARRLGQYAIAHRFGRQCLEIGEELGDRFITAESYVTLVDIEPDPVRARDYAEKHLACAGNWATWMD